ncbi:MAG: hypothetical protein IT175_03470 [Acidobacteria bacterium]|nr:hypothetical protein [Acidobacteriota bacterium]
MLAEARDVATGDTLYFNLNCYLRNDSTHTFVWFDGRRRTMTVRACSEPPEGAEVVRAAFDVSSHEINVQEGR